MPQGTPLLTIKYAVLIGFAALLSSTCRAQETTLAVHPLRDAGGLPRGLNIRLTTALSHFLNDQPDKAYRLASSKPAASTASLRYSIDGELSCATGPGDESARYLLVTRLYREEGHRILIGQWAGTAASLRYLTTNLRNVSNVHTLGLVGELGSRIGTALTVDKAGVGAVWHRLLPRFLALHSAEIELISTEEPPRLLKQPVDGARFRLRIRSSIALQAVLLSVDIHGSLRLTSLNAPTSELMLKQGDGYVSPPLILPENSVEIWVLTRQLSESKVSTPPSNRSCAIKSDDSPVHVLSGVGEIGGPLPDPLLTRLISELAQKPAEWSVLHLRVADLHR